MIGHGVRGVTVHSVPKNSEDFNVGNPFQSTPFHRPLSGFTSQQQAVRIVGTPHPNATDFAVNFDSTHGDVLLHFNPRFNEMAVIRNNTHPAGKWHNEERQGGLPFHRGKVFILDFIPEQGGNVINISVDGKHFASFSARQNMHQVNQLAIIGEVDIHMVSIH